MGYLPNETQNPASGLTENSMITYRIEGCNLPIVVEFIVIAETRNEAIKKVRKFIRRHPDAFPVKPTRYTSEKNPFLDDVLCISE